MTVDTLSSEEIHETQPHLLTELVYVPGQERNQEDSIMLPLMAKRGITHAISIGPTSDNMAEGFEKDNIPGVIARQEAFLKKNGMAPLEKAFLGLVPRPGEPKVADITKAMIEAASQRPQDRPDVETDLRAECLFTTEEGIPLLIKPADCPTAVIEARTKDGKKLLGVAHLGRPQVNEHVVEEMINHLLTHYGCNPNEIYVGFAPSIGPNNYYVRTADQQEKNLLDIAYWEGFTSNSTLNGESIIQIDVLGKILSLLHEAGIPGTNIEAYGHADAVDTFSLASQTPRKAMSNRYATSTGQPDRNGRIMVAAQL